MRGIVSFSLFGDDPDDIYKGGALENARLYSSGVYLPTHELISRFYVSLLTLEWASEFLSPIPGVEVLCVDEPDDFRATLWRYRALKDKFDFYLFRDTDSRPIQRERAAVCDWLSNGRTFHIMRDHPYHNVPMMAGLWGMRASSMIKYVQGAFYGKVRKSYYQVDQTILRASVWRLVRNDCTSHSGCEHSFGEKTIPFPEQGDPSEGFVGEGFYADGRPRFPEHARGSVG